MHIKDETTMSHDLIILGRHRGRWLLGARCGCCLGTGYHMPQTGQRSECHRCQGCGWFGIDPTLPVFAHPGSAAKVATMTVRRARDVPLWNPLDGTFEARPDDFPPATPQIEPIPPPTESLQLNLLVAP